MYNYGHWNVEGHLRRLCPPPMSIFSSSSAAVLEWRWALQCSPSLPRRAQLQTHLNEGGHRRRFFLPPRFIPSSSSAAVLEWRRTSSPPLPTVQRCSLASRPVVQQCRRSQCGSTRMKEDLATAASAYHPAVLVSLSSAVHQCHCAQCGPTEEYIA